MISQLNSSAVEFKFDPCNNPYFIRKHYEELQKQSADAPKNEASESSVV